MGAVRNNNRSVVFDQCWFVEEEKIETTLFAERKGVLVTMTTFFVTDERMLNHKCQWDDDHIETPERLRSLLRRLSVDNILDECNVIESRLATEEELNSIHSLDYIRQIANSKFLLASDAEKLSSKYEDIYLNEYSWECTQLSAGSAIALTDRVLNSPNSNGFAAIRPPGHHASKDLGCGFCLFNNIAICAKRVRKTLDRVLIIDWDVHAGQGTQYCIADDPGIYLISIHRFQNGNFWPQLMESGVKHPYKNTMNIPINGTGLGDSDYISILHNVILPFIEKWNPQMIFVSCGFDAALGDPEGEMRITPNGFGYMTGLLASQQLPLVLLLEGGYFIPSVAECGHKVLRSLICRKPTENRFSCIGSSEVLMPSLIGNLLANEIIGGGDFVERLNRFRRSKGLSNLKIEEIEYLGKREFSLPYPTRGLYKRRPEKVEEEFERELREANQIIPKTEIIEVFHKKETLIIVFGEMKQTFRVDQNLLRFIYYFVLLPLGTTYSLRLNGGDFPLRFSDLDSIEETVLEVSDFIEFPFDLGFWSK